MLRGNQGDPCLLILSETSCVLQRLTTRPVRFVIEMEGTSDRLIEEGKEGGQWTGMKPKMPHAEACRYIALLLQDAPVHCELSHPLHTTTDLSTDDACMKHAGCRYESP